jgi:hypothetical protein
MSLLRNHTPLPNPHPSLRHPKRRMIISQIIRIHLLQPPISLAPLPRPVLSLNKHKQRCARRPTNPQHTQTHAISRAIHGRLAVQKNIRRHNAPDITETNLHPRRHAALVMARHDIRHPRQHNGLRDVSARHDEEECKVLHACGEVGLCEQHDVADGRDDEAGDAKPVAVAKAVG